MRVYFRRVEVVGEVPEHNRKGCIFIANHFNGLVDPALVMTTAPCDIAPVGKSTLWKIPVLSWLLRAVHAVPVERRKDNPTKNVTANEATFDEVATCLVNGSNVLIFPEGISHNFPEVQRLRTGAARMLAKAMDRGSMVSFQAVGLEFDARDVFRSRALVIYGPHRAVSAIALAPSSQSGDLVTAITRAMADDLAELVVEGKTWETRELIARVAELLAHDEGEQSLAAHNRIGRQVEAVSKVIDERLADQVTNVRQSVSKYFDALGQAGVRDVDVIQKTRVRWRKRWVLWLQAPLALVGGLLFALPYQLPRMVARAIAGEDHDVVSTYKLGVGLVAYPLWASALIALGAWLLRWPYSLLAATVVLASPWAALAWLDAVENGPRTPLDRETLLAFRKRAVDSIRLLESAVRAHDSTS